MTIIAPVSGPACASIGALGDGVGPGGAGVGPGVGTGVGVEGPGVGVGVEDVRHKIPLKPTLQGQT
jgi:hypothetical protein